MSPVERAQQDLRKMNIDASRLEAQLSSLRARIGKAEAFIEMWGVYESGDASAEARARANGSSGGVAATAVRMCVEYIRERNEPQSTRQLLKMLEERGVQVGGNNQVGNLSGFLSRANDQLQNSRAHGWGLLEWGPPPASYMPAQEAEPACPPGEPAFPPGGDLDDEIPF